MVAKIEAVIGRDRSAYEIRDRNLCVQRIDRTDNEAGVDGFLVSLRGIESVFRRQGDLLDMAYSESLTRARRSQFGLAAASPPGPLARHRLPSHVRDGDPPRIVGEHLALPSAPSESPFLLTRFCVPHRP